MPDRTILSTEESSVSAKLLDRLLKARTILIHGEIDSSTAERVVAQLLALAGESDDLIDVYIHSQGGHVESGDTIHDMIRFVKPRVRMVGTGWVASAAAHIYLAVPRKDRFCLPNTRFLIHQPWGGIGGQAVDIGIEAEQLIKMRARLNRVIAEGTGQPLEKVEEDTRRNFWMAAPEAKEYGLVGSIITSHGDLD